MIKVSEIYTEPPKDYKNQIQQVVYETLEKLGIKYQRVETDEATTMEDCIEMNKKLDMEMVKTLILCNRQETEFYVFVTTADKKFDSKKFGQQLQIARVSFAKEKYMVELFGTQIGAATIYSVLMDKDNKLQVVIDKDVLKSEDYGCSDGTKTGYMKVKTADIMDKLLPYSKHQPIFIEM